MAIEASSVGHIAAFMSFGALASRFILETPGMLDQFAEWNRRVEGVQFNHPPAVLDHLSQHLVDIAEAAYRLHG